MVQDRKEGTTVYYSLGCDCIADLMTGLESLLRARHLRDARRFEAVVQR